MLEEKNEEKAISRKKYKKAVKHCKTLIAKLSVKTSALWFAAQTIQSQLEPQRTVEQVYEMLKFVGKNNVLQEKPDLAYWIK